ncbi:hypothetical protein VZ94_15335 [Methylocucumis oryzae]|uniref:Uncharacterized protein n=2 Tax=Methylocucumis oryzae TaxID=1632867 RepID=A0A0F3IJU9_9GAMM|nr:hypothetical protein VZ94_15335 [Methylocucumis oryzae]
MSFNLVAAEWEISTDIKQVFGYDDNVRMRQEQDAQGSFEYLLTPRLDFIRRDQQLETSLHASYGLQRYPDAQDLDYTPQDYGGGFTYRNERFIWSLNGSYSDKLSRNFAVLETGDFASAANRINWSLDPQLTFLITPIDSLAVGFNYYETEFSASFSNNQGKNVNISWQHQWSPIFKQGVSVFYSHNQFESTINSTTDSYGLNLTSSYKASEHWEATAAIGGRISEVLIMGADSVNQQSVGFLANLGLNYQGEIYSSSISLGQSLIPSGQGNLQEQAHFSWAGSYKLTKRLNTAINISYNITNSVGAGNNLSGTTTNSRNNFQLNPSIGWTVTPEINAQLSYRYRNQESLFSAESNLVMLTINFNWMGYKLSR